MTPKQIEAYIERVLKKAYTPQKMKVYNKKIKKQAKKKKNPKNALHLQYKYVDKLVQHNLKKLGYAPTKMYTPRRHRALKFAQPRYVRKAYRRANANYTNPYQQASNIYSEMYSLKDIEQQEQELNHWKTKKQEQDFLKDD